MSKNRHTEAQMIEAVKRLEAGCKPGQVAREVGVSRQTIYFWQAKYGGMGRFHIPEIMRLIEENVRLRKSIAALRRHDGCTVEDVARELGVSKGTIYAWAGEQRRVEVRQTQEATRLPDQDTRLLNLIADLRLEEELHSEV